MKVNQSAVNFDNTTQWGHYQLKGFDKAKISFAHLLPHSLSFLTKLLRRRIKYKRNYPIDILIWGLKLRLMPRGNLSEQKLFTAPQFFDYKEFKIIKKALRTKGCFIDIGANAGAYSFWANKCMEGQGRIIAVEPDPEMRLRMEFNIQSNLINSIEISDFALSNHTGAATLQVNLKQRGKNSLEIVNEDNDLRESTVVKTTTLLDLLNSKRITTVDIIKIDIEGHEAPVLQHFFGNAPPSLWPKIIISEFKKDTSADILKILISCGYRLTQTTKLNFILERE